MNLDSASLIVHRDTDSIATQITDHLSKLSYTFSFDREVFTSNVYERYFRGLMGGLGRTINGSYAGRHSYYSVVTTVTRILFLKRYSAQCNFNEPQYTGLSSRARNLSFLP